jgi:hypothetical protein
MGPCPQCRVGLRGRPLGVNHIWIAGLLRCTSLTWFGWSYRSFRRSICFGVSSAAQRNGRSGRRFPVINPRWCGCLAPCITGPWPVHDVGAGEDEISVRPHARRPGSRCHLDLRRPPRPEPLTSPWIQIISPRCRVVGSFRRRGSGWTIQPASTVDRRHSGRLHERCEPSDGSPWTTRSPPGSRRLTRVEAHCDALAH